MRLIYPLDNTVEDKEVQVTGDFIAVERCDGNLFFKPNTTTSDVINLKIIRAFSLPFKKFYLTIPTAVAGGQAIINVFSKAEAQVISTAITVILGADESGILKALSDETVKGLFRSVGDAGASPTNITGNTLLKWGDIIDGRLKLLALMETFFGTALRTSTALGASGSFINGWDDLLDKPHSVIIAIASSDQAGTLYIDQGDDATSVRRSDSLNTSPDPNSYASALLVVSIGFRYARVRYVNGATAQGWFRLSRRYAVGK